jgi:hypothetical protein
MSISSNPATGAVVGAKAISLMRSEAADASGASILLVEDEELADSSLMQQAFLEQSSAGEALIGEAGLAALLQLVLEQPPTVATAASVAGFESSLLQQPVLEQSSIFGEETAETAETAFTEPLLQLFLKQSSILETVASEAPLTRLLLLQQLSLEQSSIPETATSGTVFSTALEESPQQLFSSKQSPAFVVSIDDIESHRICLLGSDLISCECPDFADEVERFERIDA